MAYCIKYLSLEASFLSLFQILSHKKVLNNKIQSLIDEIEKLQHSEQHTYVFMINGNVAGV